MASEPTVDNSDERTDTPDTEATDTETTEHGPTPTKRTATRRATASATAKRTAAKKSAAKKSAAKRTAAKKSATATEMSEPAAEPMGGDAEDVASQEQPAPVKRARRARKATAPAQEAAPQAESTAEETPDEETTAEEMTDAVGDEPIATVPSFGLLFQAPEPVVPTRRRATSAAGAPTPRPEVPDNAPEQARQDRSDAEEGSADTGSGDAGSGDAGSDDAGSDDGGTEGGNRRSRRRGGRGRRTRAGDGPEGAAEEESSMPQSADATDSDDAAKDQGRGQDQGQDQDQGTETDGDDSTSSRRRRRRRRGSAAESDESRGARAREEVTALRGSTRLEAKKQRRREGREAGRRRQIITEAEFLARRESVERVMVVRERDGQTQIGVLEDDVLVEHYVSREIGASMIGNVYLGRVQNVLPSMEAAFVDIGKGRNAVLYAGEVNWDAAGLEGNVSKRIENALSSGDTVLVQVTKDPIGHKGARLTSQVSLPGRFLVYVPEASMTGISRKLPDTERARLKSILKKIVPDDAGVIVRTAAEGASEEELTADIERLTTAWERITTKAEKASKRKGGAPALLHGEPDLTVKVIRDVFNEDFTSLVVGGEKAWREVSEYLEDVAPELAKRLTKWTGEKDLFAHYRVDEQLAKALDRKVWLPSGGSLVIDRTEAMTVVDVNTGKFVGSGGNLEETVTKNNIEAAEEIVRQLRLRDIGGIIVIDFIDMVLESNRDLIIRRLLECLGRDRTKHQVAEVTSLGLVQMTRKRVGSGLLEVFSESCTHCNGRGLIVHSDPIDQPAAEDFSSGGNRGRGRGRGGAAGGNNRGGRADDSGSDKFGGDKFGGDKNGREKNGGEKAEQNGPTAAQIAAAAHAAALKAVAAATSVTEAVELEAGVVEEPVLLDEQVAQVARESAGDVTVTEDVLTPEPVVEPIIEPTVEPVIEPVIEPIVEPVAEPVTRPRRRRGRVVAQAGPPGQSQVRVLTVDDAPATGESD